MSRWFVLCAVLLGCAADEAPGFEVTADDLAEDAAFDQATGGGKQDGDGTLTYAAVARVVVNADVPCTGERVAIAVAVAKAESGFRPWITNTVGNSHGIDRGLWQINSYWHPDVSAECALSASCNARVMASLSKRGTKWSPWWSYNNGKHLPFMANARVAQAAVCGE